MNKNLHQYNRRQRKKLRLGEFQELGFEVRALPVGVIAPEARDAFMDAFILGAIEDHGLLFAGGFDNDLWGYVMAEGRRASATESHIDVVRAWLSKRAELTDIRVGPLRDVWHESP